jgi:lipopolysaccharide/colanic/teichoic acid biosynthesis glycosyltransferase
MVVIESSALKIGPWGRIFKRLFDIILSSIGLIFLTPLLLIIALCIKVEDPSGPIIFRNKRIGY